MLFGKKTQKSGHERLAQEMASIGAQCATISSALRSGQALPKGGIKLADTQSLFTDVNKDGIKTHTYYSFSSDLKTMDPDAQVHLMRLFGHVYVLNELIKRPEGQGEGRENVAAMVDSIAATACFFNCFFARAELSTQILMGKVTSEQIETQIRALEAEDQEKLRVAAAAMFQPQDIASHIPRERIPFMVSMSKPSEPGEKWINGVYFSAEQAPQVMEWLAAQQAKGMGSNPAHA